MRKSRALHARDRLAVLLSLVPYLLERGPVSVTEAAEHFELAPDEIRRAVRMIAVSGVPGETTQYQPNDLFDINWDELEENDHIVLTHQVAIDDSPRFSGREAAALIAGMQYLAALPENEGSDRIALLMGKLSRGASAQPSAVAVGRRTGTDGALAAIRSAIAGDTQLSFDYRNSRGGAESRDVDPFVLESVDDDWYLRGWCHLREGVRTFRVDRMTRVVRTDRPTVHRRGDVVLSERLFEASAEDLMVELSVARTALPLLGDYLTDADIADDSASDRLLVGVRVAHEHGLTRLAAAYPGLVTVLAPESARDAVAAWARAALDAYDESAAYDGATASRDPSRAVDVDGKGTLMTWWSWILIWLGLALALLGMLAFFGYRLFRKGVALLRQIEELTAKMARLTEYAEAEPVRRDPPAILVPYEQVHRRRELRRELREERILNRRAARVQRGKLLVHRNPIVK